MLDHEAGTWTVWRFNDRLPAMDVVALLQQAIDAGCDDVRAVVHNTGSVDDPNLIMS